MKIAIAESLLISHTYQKYRNILSGLLEKGESSGDHQSPELLNYSKLNDARMDRLDKTVIIPAENISRLMAIESKYTWLVLSEGWCGDAAHILPVMNKMANLSANIDLKIVFRDENEGLMNSFLTNGSKSIPKLVVVNTDDLEVRANWGPRPQGCHRFYRELQTPIR